MIINIYLLQYDVKVIINKLKATIKSFLGEMCNREIHLLKINILLEKSTRDLPWITVWGMDIERFRPIALLAIPPWVAYTQVKRMEKTPHSQHLIMQVALNGSSYNGSLIFCNTICHKLRLWRFL